MHGRVMQSIDEVKTTGPKTQSSDLGATATSLNPISRVLCVGVGLYVMVEAPLWPSYGATATAICILGQGQALTEMENNGIL